jgi:glycosyltransferase involved in cell wall biosynthesis
MRMVELVGRRADEFDVIHSHIDYFPLGLLDRQRTPFLTTLHGRLDLPEFGEIYGTYAHTPFVSISDHQRLPIPQLNWARTILHGMPANRLKPLDVKRDYLAFLGRVSPEKGLDRAIRIAAAAGMKLKVAAKVDNADKAYFESEIRPLLSFGDVEFIGEINDDQKPEFLSGAHALLFPIRWPEPFGLVMIESMACGTPVIAFRHGSVPEVMDDGVTGFIVETENDAVAALKRLPELDRDRVRQRFDERFTARRMAQDYVDLYEELIEAKKSPRLRAVAGGN